MAKIGLLAAPNIRIYRRKLLCWSTGKNLALFPSCVNDVSFDATALLFPSLNGETFIINRDNGEKTIPRGAGVVQGSWHTTYRGRQLAIEYYTPLPFFVV